MSRRVKMAEFSERGLLSPPVHVGLSTGSAPGVGGKEIPKILTYVPGQIWQWRALLFERDLTVCYASSIWLRHMLYVLYAIVLMLILRYTSFPDTEFGTLKGCPPGKNIKMCQLNTTLMESKKEFRFLIAFVLAGFVAGLCPTRPGQYGPPAKFVAGLRGTRDFLDPLYAQPGTVHSGRLSQMTDGCVTTGGW